MKIYMFQKTEEYINDYDSEFYTDEELFYKYEDAVKYLEEIYDSYIDYIDKNYCLEGEIVDDYCEIIRHSEDYYTICMKEIFCTSFKIHEKTVMSFN